jgi:hypothetical protein
VSQIGYRDVTSGGPVVDLSSSEIPAALSNSYLAVIPSTAYPTETLSVINLSTAATTVVGHLSGPVELDGSTIAWVDQKGVPRVAPLAVEPDQPRFLGDPDAPTTYATSSGNWNAEFDTSAPLTSCSVAITLSSTPVATLPCTKSDMAVGDADVKWNGTTTAGDSVLLGTYTWTLSASNADGALESPSGGALTLSGSIAVTGPSTTTNTAASVNPTTAVQGQSVTYKVTVTSGGGTPSGSVHFSIGTTSLCTATLSAGVGSCTATNAPSGLTQ